MEDEQTRGLLLRRHEGSEKDGDAEDNLAAVPRPDKDRPRGPFLLARKQEAAGKSEHYTVLLHMTNKHRDELVPKLEKKGFGLVKVKLPPGVKAEKHYEI